jgi:hypothetical protein
LRIDVLTVTFEGGGVLWGCGHKVICKPDITTLRRGSLSRCKRRGYDSLPLLTRSGYNSAVRM